MSIGLRIREARKKKNLTQAQLAKLLGVKQGAVGNYESEVSNPKESVLIKIMEVLEVDANYLFQDVADFVTKKKTSDYEDLAMDFFIDAMLSDDIECKEFLAKLEGAFKVLQDEDWKYLSRSVDFVIQERISKNKD